MVNLMVERATSDMLIGPDWAMNLEICDMLNRDPAQAKDVVKGIKKRLGSKNPKVQLLTLTLLETLVKNCGDIVHLHVAEKDVLHELVRLVKKKPDFHVKDKILTLIDTWQEAFGGPRARYPQYYAAYQELLRAGAVFPQRPEGEAPVLTPPQTQPLSTYPPNVRNSDFPHEAPAEPSSQSQQPTLSATEIQNARGIMDVLSEMLTALEPGNKEGLRQEVIVDLVEQCRTYKQRVVHLVTNTSDETLMFQGLALSDDLDRVLEKHETIASGAPIRVEHPRTEPTRVIPVDNLLIDTGDSREQVDRRPTLTADINAQSDPPLLALPAPSATTSTPPSVKLDPKVDLLSGDDYNSPTAQSNLALVPIGGAQPVSPLSEQKAIVLVDFYSESNMTSSSGAQPSYLDGLTQPSTHPFDQQQNLPSLQPLQYAYGVPQTQQQNPQSSQPSLYANGNAQISQQSSHMSQPAVYTNESAQNPLNTHKVESLVGMVSRSHHPPYTALRATAHFLHLPGKLNLMKPHRLPPSTLKFKLTSKCNQPFHMCSRMARILKILYLWQASKWVIITYICSQRTSLSRSISMLACSKCPLVKCTHNKCMATKCKGMATHRAMVNNKTLAYFSNK